MAVDSPESMQSCGCGAGQHWHDSQGAGLAFEHYQQLAVPLRLSKLVSHFSLCNRLAECVTLAL